MEEGLLRNTGKRLAEWKVILLSKKLSKHKEIMDYLKGEEGITHGFANFVSLKYREADAGSTDDSTLIENQYEGKEILIPIKDKLIEIIKKFGDDTQFIPKKDSISCKRKTQFALIKPATKKRIDLGLKIKGKQTEGKLENSGSFGTMCTHRVKLESVEEINNELINWIKEAYSLAN